MGKSAGKKDANYATCKLDSEKKPTGSEYGVAPSHESIHPDKLTLPAGQTKPGGMPQGKLN